MRCYGSGRNAFCGMDPILDPSAKKLVTVTRVGTSSKGTPWAQGALYFEGRQFETWINELEGESPVGLIAGKTYDVCFVKPVSCKKDGDIRYRSYVKPNPFTQSQEPTARYRLTKSNRLYLKEYAESHNLRTKGHWTHGAIDHLVKTVREEGLIPDLVHHSSEQ